MENPGGRELFSNGRETEIEVGCFQIGCSITNYRVCEISPIKNIPKKYHSKRFVTFPRKTSMVN